MKCQRCGSKRVLESNAHASDRQSYSLGKIEIRGEYAPDIPEICNGDDLFPNICLDCGQTQGKFPKSETEYDINTGLERDD